MRRLEVEDAGVCNIIHVNHTTQIRMQILKKLKQKHRLDFVVTGQPASFLKLREYRRRFDSSQWWKQNLLGG